MSEIGFLEKTRRGGLAAARGGVGRVMGKEWVWKVREEGLEREEERVVAAAAAAIIPSSRFWDLKSLFFPTFSSNINIGSDFF